jgi:hypothetical protein
MQSEGIDVSEYFDASEGQSSLGGADDSARTVADSLINPAKARSITPLADKKQFPQVDPPDTPDDTIVSDGAGDESEGFDEGYTDDAIEGELVMRDTNGGSIMTDFANAILFRQKYLPCTKATEADSRRLKRAALNLLMFYESEDIYAALMNRLQRMMDREAQLAEQERRFPTSVPLLARRLKVFLQQISSGRILTGEGTRLVSHELAWAAWICEAASTGVMHVKTRECRCKSEWSR